ncbi:hypothetical protein JVU11DRAFT_4911 [Chiua virens]|nr:hypothetical protein JVU11DRAFT_4911 [Chiua virens]
MTGSLSELWWNKVVRELRDLDPSEVPEHYSCGIGFYTVSVNPQEYIPWLKTQLSSRGVSFQRQEVRSLEELRPLVGPKGILVNASSLGSKSIIGVEDTKLYPIRGQAILIRSPEIRECLFVQGEEDQLSQGGEATYMIPRPGTQHSDTILLGGTFQSGNWDTSVDMDVAQRIFERCAKFAPSLRDTGVTKILRHQVGLRPGREGGARVEAEVVKFPLRCTHNLVPWDPSGLGDGSMQVVHAYGFGAGGYQASWGAATEVLALVKARVEAHVRSSQRHHLKLATSAMSLADIGKNDISEETQALKDRLASRDTENAGLRTQLMRREAELEELRATFNDTIYKLSKEAERILQLEEEVSARSSELKTEHIALQNTTLALQTTQEKLKAEERAKKELESTLDTVSLHSQATSTEHQSVQREKRALESRVRELERIVQTHEAKGASNIPRRNGRPRSSSVSSFRLPAVEQELTDIKAQVHTKDMDLRAMEKKLSQAKDDLVKAENARISIDKAGQKRISELLSDLERKEEELETLKESDRTGEREEELMERIDEDAAKIAALEKLVAESQATQTSQARLQKLQSQLKAECEKVHRSDDHRNRLLQEKEELVRQYEASRRETYESHQLLLTRERQIKELETKHAQLVVELDTHHQESISSDVEQASSHCQRPDGVSGFPNASALADHVQGLLQAIDRLRNERDELKRALEFSEVEYRVTTEGFQTRIASLMRQSARGAHDDAMDTALTKSRVERRTKELVSCAAALTVVISNLQARLDLSQDLPCATSADLSSSNSQLHHAFSTIDSQKQSSATGGQEQDDLLHNLDITTKELSEAHEELALLRLQLTDAEGQITTVMERLQASENAREEALQDLLLAEQRSTTLSRNCQDMESERNSLAVQITNIQDNLACVQGELADAQTRYDALHSQQLSPTSTSKVVQARKDRIQELETRIVHYTNQIGDYQHDIRQLEANVKLHEERIAEMTSEVELLASQKEAMVEDCAEAREARDGAVERLGAYEEEVEGLQQQLDQAKEAHNTELSAMALTVENLTFENRQATARLADLETENAGVTRELDRLRLDHERLSELENNAELPQAVMSLAVIHCAYRNSVRLLHESYHRVKSLESQAVDLRRELEQKGTLAENAEKEKHELLLRLSDVSKTRPQDDSTVEELSSMCGSSQQQEVKQNDVDLFRNLLQEKEQELATTRQLFEESQSCHAEVEAELLERVATMSKDLQARIAQVEDVAGLQLELENTRTQLKNSMQNFADLEKFNGDVIEDLISVKEVFERRATQIDEQIRALIVDHQHSLATMEAKYKSSADVLATNLEDREHELNQLRQQLQDVSDSHALTEGKLHEELRSYEERLALADDLEKDLRQTITDVRQRLTEEESETLSLQEEHQLLQAEISGLRTEVQRSTSLIRYLESQVRGNEDACVLLKERLQQAELSLVESEEACKVAELNLTLQTTQHEKVVTTLRREVASLQSGPELRSALVDLEEKNHEMDGLLRAKCQEIEEYDDRILETLKANKKLTSKVESLTRKVQTLQAKLSSLKTQPQETFPPVPVPTVAQAGSYSTSSHVRESSGPSLTLRSKTPEPGAVVLPSSHTPCRTSEPSGNEISAGKKRPAPDDDERDGVPAEGHYSTDACLRNEPTPRLRRAHGHPTGFTPVRGASLRKAAGQASPGRRAHAGTKASEIITDVTNSPSRRSGKGDHQLKKSSWLGKIRSGAGSQSSSSRERNMATYDSLHRQCRTLESLFDSKLTSYARLASAIARSQDDVESSGSRERWPDLENEVEDLLEKLKETNDALLALSATPDSIPPQSVSRAIQRHREVYQDYAREFQRTKANIHQALDQANLLAGVRNDIDAYKSSAADSLLAERSRIDSSHRMTDDILEQAYETRAEFSRQSSSLAGINTRVAGVINAMPGINNVLAMIKTRRRRDGVIIGVVIAVCLLLLLSYMSR